MKSLLTTMAMLAAANTAYAEDTKHFDGGFLGGEVGYLSGDGPTGTYYGGFIGVRKQTDTNLVFGVEGARGTTAVSYVYDHSDSENFYKTQWLALGTAGFASGRNLFVLGAGYARANSSYVYDGEYIDESFSAITGMVGYERAIGSFISLRARVVTYEFNQYIPSIGVALRF